jgi:phosphoenolpyruvate carboxykinase (ATP)
MPKKRVYHNLSTKKLREIALARKEVLLSKYQNLVLYTGKHTGRSPNDKFIVKTKNVTSIIDWGKINQPLSPLYFDRLYQKMKDFFASQKEYFIVDCLACALPKYALKVRVYCEHAYQALFVNHLFRKVKKTDLKNFKPDLTLYVAPSVYADPALDGVNSETFIVLNFEKNIVLIGATKYLGEIKKAVFTYLNFLLPKKRVLPMHCAANVDKKGKNTALFFGLSGTGKTTLSSDPTRRLIGDDEHGWSKEGVFNFEGGCYAKCIRLKKEAEPQIWEAVHQKETILENVVLKDDLDFDFESEKYTENTRAAYPLKFIKNAVLKGVGPHPSYIIFLTADAFGVLPPVAKLDIYQALYHFLSGYTSKLAGTEQGVIEPKPVFSAFFGAPFMPLKPKVYLTLFYHYLKKYQTKVYLVNTGWVGGGFGVGHRIAILDTRNIVKAILEGKVDKTECFYHPIFNLNIPKNIAGVNSNLLDPSFSWTNKKQYQKEAKKLAALFVENIKKYADIPKEVISSGPKI